MRNAVEFKAQSMEEFAAGASWFTGDSEVQFKACEPVIFTTSTFGACQLHAARVPLYDAQLPKRLEVAGMAKPICVFIQLKGETVFDTVDFSKIVKPGSMVLYDRSRPIEFRTDGSSAHLVMHCPRHLAPMVIQRAVLKTTMFEPDTAGLPSVCFDFFHSLHENVNSLDAISKSVLQRTIVSLIGDLIAFSARDEDINNSLGLAALRTRAMGFTEANLDKLRGVEDLAVNMGCSPRYLHKAFSERGMTPANYIWSLRLNRAREQIVTAGFESSITEIAFGCGFTSYSHFSRAFKMKFGNTPREELKRRETDI